MEDEVKINFDLLGTRERMIKIGFYLSSVIWLDESVITAERGVPLKVILSHIRSILDVKLQEPIEIKKELSNE